MMGQAVDAIESTEHNELSIRLQKELRDENRIKNARVIFLNLGDRRH